MKAGTLPYPGFLDNFVDNVLPKYPRCGWRVVYETSDVKYDSKLKQIKTSKPGIQYWHKKEEEIVPLEEF